MKTKFQPKPAPKSEVDPVKRVWKKAEGDDSPGNLVTITLDSALPPNVEDYNEKGEPVRRPEGTAEVVVVKKDGDVHRIPVSAEGEELEWIPAVPMELVEIPEGETAEQVFEDLVVEAGGHSHAHEHGDKIEAALRAKSKEILAGGDDEPEPEADADAAAKDDN